MSDAKTYAKEIHKTAQKNFKRRSVYAYYINDLWSADLVDVSNISEDNDNVKFLLNIIDVYSRYSWSIPLKNKSSKSVLEAFKCIKTTPKNLWTHEGKEFFNKDFLKYCKDNNINLYHTYSGLKAVFI